MGLKIRKYGAASTPHPATTASFQRCWIAHNRIIFAGVSFPSQSINKYLHKKLPTNIRTRLCIKPVAFSSRMPASTKDSPWYRCTTLKFILVVAPRDTVVLGFETLGGGVGKCHKFYEKFPPNQFFEKVLFLACATTTIRRA